MANKDKILTGLEYLLGTVMVLGGIDTLTEPVVVNSGFVAGILYGHTSLVAVGAIFIVLGLLLLYGCARRKEKWRAYSLMAIYLVNIFVGLLALVAFGFLAFDWLDAVVLGAVAAILWLNLQRKKHGWNWKKPSWAGIKEFLGR